MAHRCTSVDRGERIVGPEVRKRPLVVCDHPWEAGTPSATGRGPVVEVVAEGGCGEEVWEEDLGYWMEKLESLWTTVATVNAKGRRAQAILCSRLVLKRRVAALQVIDVATDLAPPHPNEDRDRRRNPPPLAPLVCACCSRAPRSLGGGDRRGRRAQSCDRCLHESHHGS